MALQRENKRDQQVLGDPEVLCNSGLAAKALDPACPTEQDNLNGVCEFVRDINIYMLGSTHFATVFGRDSGFCRFG